MSPFPGGAHRTGRRNVYPAEKARQGTIILRHWWGRAIFIASLAIGAASVVLWSVAY